MNNSENNYREILENSLKHITEGNGFYYNLRVMA